MVNNESFVVIRKSFANRDLNLIHCVMDFRKLQIQFHSKYATINRVTFGDEYKNYQKKIIIFPTILGVSM